jgi:hypothetical protein
MMKIALVLFVCSQVAFAQQPIAQSFGDEVAECAVLRSKANPSKAPQDFFSECEKYVQRGREVDAFQKHREEQFQEAQSDFASCINRNIPRLDDGRSSADVIATGILGSCQSQLNSDVAMSKEFAEAITPKLIAKVLEYRAAHRKQPQNSAKPNQ